jgi:hypothetical protein
VSVYYLIGLPGTMLLHTDTLHTATLQIQLRSALEILFMSLFWFGQGVSWGGHFYVLCFYDFPSL